MSKGKIKYSTEFSVSTVSDLKAFSEKSGYPQSHILEAGYHLFKWAPPEIRDGVMQKKRVEVRAWFRLASVAVAEQLILTEVQETDLGLFVQRVAEELARKPLKVDEARSDGLRQAGGKQR